MEYLAITIKLVIGLSVLNVWLLRANKPTQWRGGATGSLKDEFKAYGLSTNVMRVIGAIKIVLALLIIASIFYPPVEDIGAIGMAVMMTGAIAMHIKIKDPLKRSLPAFIFLCLSLSLLVI
jgi:hypothetical protein